MGENTSYCVTGVTRHSPLKRPIMYRYIYLPTLPAPVTPTVLKAQLQARLLVRKFIYQPQIQTTTRIHHRLPCCKTTALSSEIPRAPNSSDTIYRTCLQTHEPVSKQQRRPLPNSRPALNTHTQSLQSQPDINQQRNSPANSSPAPKIDTQSLRFQPVPTSKQHRPPPPKSPPAPKIDTQSLHMNEGDGNSMLEAQLRMRVTV